MKKNKNKTIAETFEKNKKSIYNFGFGFAVCFVVMMIFYPSRIATLKDGTEPVLTFGDNVITADDLYEDMKEYFSVAKLIDKVDRIILEDMYELTEEDNTEIEETASYYLSSYEQNYGMTEEQFLTQNGFGSREKFIEQLSLDFMRNKYYQEYSKTLISEEDINAYYTTKVFGDISTKYINVVSENSTEGKNTVNTILKSLKNGMSYEEAVTTYKDQISNQDLGYVSFDSGLEEAYLNALLGLKDGSFSTSYVETSQGYTIIFRDASKEVEKLEDLKERIVSAIIKDKESVDNNLYFKSIVHLREENNLKFSDTVMKSKYEKIVDSY